MSRGRIALVGLGVNLALGLALLMLAGTTTEAGARTDGPQRVCVEAAPDCGRTVPEGVEQW